MRAAASAAVSVSGNMNNAMTEPRRNRRRWSPVR